MKLWDDITPDTHPNKARAIREDEKHRNQMIAENNKTYLELQLRKKAVLPAWDDFMDRLSTKGEKK